VLHLPLQSHRHAQRGMRGAAAACVLTAGEGSCVTVVDAAACVAACGRQLTVKVRSIALSRDSTQGY
jgi:hypothetical protein